MSALEALRESLPEAARDLKIGIQSVLGAESLTPPQRWGVALASGFAARNPALRDALLAEARAAEIDDAVIDDARAAAALMAMNNVYYRFVHLASAADYKTLPAKLRMNAIANPGVDKVDFELWSLAVSAVNGCGLCIDSHEKVVRQAGLSAEQVQAAVRIASVVHAVAVTLESDQSAAIAQAA